MQACGTWPAAAAQDIGLTCHSFTPGHLQGKTVLPWGTAAIPHPWLLPQNKCTEKYGIFSKGWCREPRDKIAVACNRAGGTRAEQDSNSAILCPQLVMRASPSLHVSFITAPPAWEQGLQTAGPWTTVGPLMSSMPTRYLFKIFFTTFLKKWN